MSQIALKFSALTRYAGRHGNAMALAAVLGLSAATVAPVHADGTKIGFVSPESTLCDSKPAKIAQAKIVTEFKDRDATITLMVADCQVWAKKPETADQCLSHTEPLHPLRTQATLNPN